MLIWYLLSVFFPLFYFFICKTGYTFKIFSLFVYKNQYSQPVSGAHLKINLISFYVSCCWKPHWFDKTALNQTLMRSIPVAFPFLSCLLECLSALSPREGFDSFS